MAQKFRWELCLIVSNPLFYGALHVLLTSLINKYIASRIIIITPLHRSDCEKSHIGERNIGTANNLTLRNYVEVIREVAEYYLNLCRNDKMNDCCCISGT